LKRPPLIPPRLGERAIDSCTRSVIALAGAHFATEPTTPQKIVKRRWGDEDATAAAWVSRSVTSIASTASGGPYDEIIGPLAGPALFLSGAAAFSQVLARSVVVNFGGLNGINIPALTVNSSTVPFTLQGAPINAVAFDFSDSQTLTPRKFALLWGMTRELAEHSECEPLVRSAITRGIELAGDAALLGTADATETANAGLRNNISALSATSGATLDAMRVDLGNLAAGPASVGGLNLLYVMAPEAAVKVALAYPNFKFPIFASSVFAASKIVMCVAPDALVTVFDPKPNFSVSNQALIHFDSAAQAVSTGGSIATGGGLVSLLQQDMIAVRCVFNVSWVLRSPSAVSWTQSINW
jgi:hypothetical protein